ncbi:hypothetical protein OH77DRAFT_1432407 [Trametes cingulata]|nr:hypothetical protein OH77DRAFT_1432407 [Trametes cingulata]
MPKSLPSNWLDEFEITSATRPAVSSSHGNSTGRRYVCTRCPEPTPLVYKWEAKRHACGTAHRNRFKSAQTVSGVRSTPPAGRDRARSPSPAESYGNNYSGDNTSSGYSSSEDDRISETLATARPRDPRLTAGAQAHHGSSHTGVTAALALVV